MAGYADGLQPYSCVATMEVAFHAADLSAAGGVHGVAQTLTPYDTAFCAMESSLVESSASSIWIRWRESPAPVVVDQRVSGSLAFVKLDPRPSTRRRRQCAGTPSPGSPSQSSLRASPASCPRPDSRPRLNADRGRVAFAASSRRASRSSRPWDVRPGFPGYPRIAALHNCRSHHTGRTFGARQNDGRPPSPHCLRYLAKTASRPRQLVRHAHGRARDDVPTDEPLLLQLPKTKREHAIPYASYGVSQLAKPERTPLEGDEHKPRPRLRQHVHRCLEAQTFPVVRVHTRSMRTRGRKESSRIVRNFFLRSGIPL